MSRYIGEGYISLLARVIKDGSMVKPPIKPIRQGRDYTINQYWITYREIRNETECIMTIRWNPDTLTVEQVDRSGACARPEEQD